MNDEVSRSSPNAHGAAVGLLFFLLTACATNSASAPPTTRPAFLSAPAAQANSDYWFNKPPVASVASPDFQKLWDACRATAINDQFEIDQEDYRLGLLRTFPMISKQFFEFWRSDAGDVREVAWDSLQTIRRTIRFDFTRQPDGSFIVYPKVLIETSAHPERRITSQAQYSQAFTTVAEAPTIINDQGVSVPTRYWYSVGRDDAMEKELANSVREKLDN
jgi:hypothetical protein